MLRDLSTLAVVGLAAAAGLYVVGRRMGVTQATFNPASPQNAVYQGVNAIGRGATGDEHWNLGAWMWETFNPVAAAADRAATSGTDRPAGASGAWEASGGASGGWGDGFAETPAGAVTGMVRTP